MATVDYWLTIEGVDVESEDSKLSKHIQLEQWSWGEKNSGSWDTNGGGGFGKVVMNDFKFSMWFNKASPKLFQMCATGEHVKKATLVCRKAGGGQQTFLEIEFENLVISSFDIVGDEERLHPRNDVTFNFETIQLKYMPQKPDGTVGAASTAGYNLKKNEKK